MKPRYQYVFIGLVLVLLSACDAGMSEDYRGVDGPEQDESKTTEPEEPYYALDLQDLSSRPIRDSCRTPLEVCTSEPQFIATDASIILRTGERNLQESEIRVSNPEVLMLIEVQPIYEGIEGEMVEVGSLLICETGSTPGASTVTISHNNGEASSFEIQTLTPEFSMIDFDLWIGLHMSFLGDGEALRNHAIIPDRIALIEGATLELHGSMHSSESEHHLGGAEHFAWAIDGSGLSRGRDLESNHVIMVVGTDSPGESKVFYGPNRFTKIKTIAIDEVSEIRVHVPFGESIWAVKDL